MLLGTCVIFTICLYHFIPCYLHFSQFAFGAKAKTYILFSLSPQTKANSIISLQFVCLWSYIIRDMYRISKFNIHTFMENTTINLPPQSDKRSNRKETTPRSIIPLIWLLLYVLPPSFSCSFDLFFFLFFFDHIDLISSCLCNLALLLFCTHHFSISCVYWKKKSKTKPRKLWVHFLRSFLVSTNTIYGRNMKWEPSNPQQ